MPSVYFVSKAHGVHWPFAPWDVFYQGERQAGGFWTRWGARKWAENAGAGVVIVSKE